MTEGVQIGRIYEGRVTSIKEFGAFVEILPGKDGLVHISELSDGYVSSVTDICRVGDPMLVKAIAVDDQDRVKLSRKAALAERGVARRIRVPNSAARGPVRPTSRRWPAAARRAGLHLRRATVDATGATGVATATATVTAIAAAREARHGLDGRRATPGGGLVPAG